LPRLLAEYQDDLSLMRVLTLICLFEIDGDIKIASHFLHAAVCLGQANGFDGEGVPLPSLEEAERHQWLRLWETMRFLSLYNIFSWTFRELLISL
jgi:hypothetical protein